MHPIITAHGLGHALSNGRWLFQGLDLTLGDGLTGLVGANGIGKTCLVKLLAGEIEPAAGAIRRSGPVQLLAQRERPPSVAVRDFLPPAHARSPIAQQLLKDIDGDAPCASLSGGQWMRVRLARLDDAAYPILDEPTNDLDAEGRAIVSRYLATRHGALLVSHDRELLEHCDGILELTRHGIMKFSGGWSAYREASGAERGRLQDALRVARRERDAAGSRRAEGIERRARQARHATRSAAKGGMPKILMGARKRRAEQTRGRLGAADIERAQQALQVAHEALDRQKVDAVMYAGLQGEALPAQKLVARAQGFNVRYQQRWVYSEDLDFAWHGNQRIAIQGGNGSGKTTLLCALRGDPLDTRGELARGDAAMLYLDQRCGILDDEATVLQNLAGHRIGTESELRTALAGFLFAGNAVFQKAASLSGGERLRVALAIAFLGAHRPQLMMLDEPTNNLDAANVEFLEGVVAGFLGAVIVVSHDARFLANCGVSGEFVLPGRVNA